MTYLEHLQRILDLDDPIQEARKKLGNTYMAVNGVLLLIGDFFDTAMSVENKEGKTEELTKIETLETFLPDSGVYHCKKGYSVLLLRLPKRQWLRSLSFTFYKRKWLSGKEYKGWQRDLYDNRYTHTNIFEDGKHKLWWWDIPIGYKNKGGIVCTDSNFEQELRDWSRDANIHTT